MALSEPRSLRDHCALAITLGLCVLAGVAVALHVDSARLLSHVNGIHLLLADLLARGIFYPPTPTAEIAYGTFYQPLAFAPLALLPGEGLEKVRGLRLLCACDVALALGLAVLLARRLGALARQAHAVAALALLTAPVGFCALAMRDDPRGVWLGLLALLAHLRGGRFAPWLAALCLALAFFTKITAPFAPFCAIAFDHWRRDRRGCLRFCTATALAVLVPFAIVELGCGVALFDNGVRLALLEPAYQPRDLLHTTWRLVRDVFALEERAFGLAPLALLSLATLAARFVRARCDLADVLVLAAFAKAWLAYRNPGADWNHLFDLALFVAVHLVVRAGARLASWGAVLVLLSLLALDRPWELLLGRERLPLAEAPAAKAARDLATLPRVPTLVEDPLVQLLADSTPKIPDCGVVLGRLRRHPEVRTTWFAEPGRPGALERMVLLFDPFASTAERPGPYWYSVVNFDAAFHAELRAHWHVVRSTEYAAFLERVR